MFDIFFLSYHEPQAEENWQKILNAFKYRNPSHIKNINGILNAHKQAAAKSQTEMLWVIDADNVLIEGFGMDYSPPYHQRDHVHVWSSLNPINKLQYGYGGIKLIPKKTILNMKDSYTDMTTTLSEKFISIKSLASITKFNTSSFDTWKAAFRECAKLSRNQIQRSRRDETEMRLNIWNSIFDESEDFWMECKAGAKSGTQFGETSEDLSLINNWEWLRNQYEKEKLEFV